MVQPLTLSAPSRVHFGLIGMNDQTARRFGGVGLGIDHFRTVIDIEANRTGDLDVEGGDAAAITLAKHIATKLGATGMRITLRQMPPRHCGFGSGTTLALALTEGISLALGQRLAIPAIKRTSGRGGASGIGSAVYFAGGFVADGGHQQAPTEAFLPSGAVSGDFTVPKCVWRMHWPEAWQLLIAYPPTFEVVSGKEEVDFFAANLPVALETAAMAALALTFELPSALRSLDFSAFRTGLNRSWQSGFKQAEVLAQLEVVNVLRTIAEVSSVCATMSSMGPALLIVGRDAAAIDAARSMLPSEWRVISGGADNFGRQVAFAD